MPPAAPPSTSGRPGGGATAPPPPPTRLPVFDSVSRYEKLGRIGEGTYGVVYKARDTTTGALVALKRLRMGRDAPGCEAGHGEYGRDGLSITSVRELACLQAGARDPHLVRLLGVVTDHAPDAVFLVFEYCPYELAAVLDASPRAFSVAQVKTLVWGLLAALEGLHARFTLHRDVKPSNLLLTGDGVLRLCDCGLARPLPAMGLARLTPGETGGGGGGGGVPAGGGGHDDENEMEASTAPLPPPPLTCKIQTLWYRAPEILWGATTYGEGVDLWSAGCVMGELLGGQPLFPERTDEGVVAAHARLLGVPSPRIWPALAHLPGYTTRHSSTLAAAGSNPYNFLASAVGVPAGLTPAGCDLLNGLLTYDPSARLTARAALRHAWFTEERGGEPSPAEWGSVGRAAARALEKGRETGREM